jgi:hypothetical protein
MTLDEITEIDKEVLAARYEAAITEEFSALAEFLGITLETMLARSRAASRVIGQMHEIAPEYDFEMELLDLIRREGGVALMYRLEVVRFFDDNAADLAELDLDGTLAAILKWRYRDQPTRFEWGYDPDALQQQDRWQKFSTEELKSLKQVLTTADDESVLDDIGVEIRHQIEEAIRWRTTNQR